MKTGKNIVEKKLGISPDYQYRAMRQSLWAKKNWHRNKFTVTRMLYDFSKKDDVLDLGTGSGNFELIFARSVNLIYGVDYHKEALEFLHKKLQKSKLYNVHLECSDMRSLSPKLNRKKYDLIVSVDTIEHISKNDGGHLVEWAKTRLKNGGRLLIITPNYKSAWVFVEKLLDWLSFTPNMGRHQHLSKYSVASMTNLLLKKGFKIEKLVTFNLFSFLLPGWLNKKLLQYEINSMKKAGCLMAVVASVY